MQAVLSKPGVAPEKKASYTKVESSSGIKRHVNHVRESEALEYAAREY